MKKNYDSDVKIINKNLNEFINNNNNILVSTLYILYYINLFVNDNSVNDINKFNISINYLRNYVKTNLNSEPKIMNLYYTIYYKIITNNTHGIFDKDNINNGIYILDNYILSTGIGFNDLIPDNNELTTYIIYIIKYNKEIAFNGILEYASRNNLYINFYKKDSNGFNAIYYASKSNNPLYNNRINTYYYSSNLKILNSHYIENYIRYQSKLKK